MIRMQLFGAAMVAAIGLLIAPSVDAITITSPASPAQREELANVL